MPRKAVTSEAKRFALNMKTTEEIRRRLEKAARASGRSLTHEVEHRLEQSFQEEDLLRRYFGSDDAIELLKRLSFAINYHSKRSGKPWQTDKDTRKAIRAHLAKIFDEFDDEEKLAKISHASSTLQEVSNFSLTDSFTSQEIEFLRWSGESTSYKQIAQKLGTSEERVEFYISSLLDRVTATLSEDETGSASSTPPGKSHRGRAA